MKNRNEQPSAKQKANQDMQNRTEQHVKNKAENRMESCSKNKDMKNIVNHAKQEMRTENNTMKHMRKDQ